MSLEHENPIILPANGQFNVKKTKTFNVDDVRRSKIMLNHKTSKTFQYKLENLKRTKFKPR